MIDTPKTENSVRTIDIPNFLERRGTGVCEETLWISGKSEVISDCGKNTAETSQEDMKALSGVKPDQSA